MTTKVKKVSLSKPGGQEAKAAVKVHEPTPRERVALTAHLARRMERVPSPRLKVTEAGNSTKMTVDHPDPLLGQLLLMEALGTAEGDFANELLQQFGRVGAVGGRVDETALNFLIAAVKGMKPRDPVETMLVAQMAVIHASMMDLASRLAQADHFAQAEFAEQGINKLARTFSMQTDALKRYRGGGEQRVVVQHQHVNVAANQAQVNVGGTPQGGGVSLNSTEQSHEKPAALTHAPEQAMPCAVEANREAVPSGGSERLDRLPQPRGRGRRAPGQ